MTEELKALSKYEEKVLIVMHWLNDQSDFAVKGEIRILPKTYPYSDPTWHEAERIMLQLEEQGCLKISSVNQFENIFHITKSTEPRDVNIQPPFYSKIEQLQRCWEYQESLKPKVNKAEQAKALEVALAQIEKSHSFVRQKPQQPATTSPSPPPYKLRVSYSTTSGEVLLNDIFLLSNPKVGSDHQRLFAYLFQHPNQIHTTANLAAAGIRYRGEPSHFVRDLGFVGDLAKAFFMVSKEGYLFRNPLTAATLQELKLTNIRLRTK